MPRLTTKLPVMKSRLNIKTAFKNAFPTRPIPSQLFLDGLEIKNWDIPGELQNRLLSHEWTRVSIEDWASIGPIASIKSYVTPMAFRYYLPSILLGSIENLTYWDLGLEALLPNNFKRVQRRWPTVGNLNHRTL